MSVVISIEDTGPCRKQMVVEVPAPAVDAEHRRVVAELGKEVVLPGFRKGKVPRSVVERRFKEDIDRTVLDRLLPRYWRQAQAESGIDPLLPPEVQKVELAAGEPLKFHASVEVRPQIELGDLDGLQLPEPETEPLAEEVADAIEDLRRRHGSWAPVERTAARGDLVDLEIIPLDGIGPEAAVEGPTEPQKLSIEVGDERVWEELSMAVTGLAAGQKGEFARAMGDESETSERRFRVQVAAVKERELPPLDDDFAGTVGDFENLEGLRKEVTDHIRRSKQTARRRERERTFLARLREMHPLELPEGVVSKEAEGMLARHAEQLAAQGVDLDRAEIDWAALMESAKPQAGERVHTRLLLDALVRSRGIEVSEQEFEGALAGIARAQGTSTQAVRQALDRNDRLQELRAQLGREKAIQQLIGEEGASEDEASVAGSQAEESP